MLVTILSTVFSISADCLLIGKVELRSCFVNASLIILNQYSLLLSYQVFPLLNLY